MSASDEDYPAAHSMDTRWFSVDADGHVALFDSGQDGPVPVGVQDALWDDLGESLIRSDSGFVYDLVDLPQDGAIAVCAGSEAEHGYDLAGAPIITKRDLLGNVYPTCRALVWLRSASDSALLEGASSVVVPSADGLLLLGEFSRAGLASMHDEGRLRRAWLHHTLDPSRFGFFRFSPFPVDFQLSIGDSPPEPWPVHYFRTGRPRQPVVFSALPVELRNGVGVLEISGVNFHTVDEIDVCAIFDCWGWASGGRVELKRPRR
jgi:hypothetical protein